MHRQRGFGYLAVLFVVAVGGVALASVGVLWSTEHKREKEEQLLAIGLEFRQAIGLYYERSPGAVKRYPQSLDELLKDTRFLTVQRYLRQIYIDPMTTKRKWGLIQAPEGGIMGVYSVSPDPVLKQANFPLALSALGGKVTYRDWQFIYRPVAIVPKQ